jgi:hypothetical protein
MWYGLLRLFSEASFFVILSRQAKNLLETLRFAQSDNLKVQSDNWKFRVTVCDN